ncbi:MAG: metallophosphoesterase family protein [Defluviitaleaceae bacterium]|nr:metallophosphoesterase family protein [Defluviitaleaceae bacterium]
MKKSILSKSVNIALFLAAITGAIHIGHALTLDRIMQYVEVPFHSPRWPANLEGYRIAFITDTHRMSNNALQQVVDELNTRNIDLLLLGGDFWAHYERTLAILANTNTTDGIFGVEGNHDIHIRLFAEMERHGMTPLSNSGKRIHEGFWLAGLEDLWNRNPSIAAATEGADDDFVLLLTHNPDVTMQQDTTGIDLVVSGHTHAGQIRLFGAWAPLFTFTNIVTSYGQRFVSGWATSRDGSPVYVSNGTGSQVPRVFARPQVIILTMHGN